MFDSVEFVSPEVFSFAIRPRGRAVSPPPAAASTAFSKDAFSKVSRRSFDASVKGRVPASKLGAVGGSIHAGADAVCVVGSSAFAAPGASDDAEGARDAAAPARRSAEASPDHSGPLASWDSCSSGPLVGASADASEAVGGETARARSLWRAKESVGVVGDRPCSVGTSTTAVGSEAAFSGAPGDPGFFAVAALLSLSRFTGSVAPSSSAPARAPSGGASAPRVSATSAADAGAAPQLLPRRVPFHAGLSVACPQASSAGERSPRVSGSEASRGAGGASVAPPGERIARVVGAANRRGARGVEGVVAWRARARRRRECRRKGPRSLSKTSKTAIRHEALGAWWTFCISREGGVLFASRASRVVVRRDAAPP